MDRREESSIKYRQLWTWLGQCAGSAAQAWRLWERLGSSWRQGEDERARNAAAFILSGRGDCTIERTIFVFVVFIFLFFYSRWILLVKLPSVWSSHIQNQLKIFKKNVLSWTKPGVVWENVLTNAKRSLEILMTCSVSSVILGKDSIPLLLSLSALLLEEYN